MTIRADHARALVCAIEAEQRAIGRRLDPDEWIATAERVRAERGLEPRSPLRDLAPSPGAPVHQLRIAGAA